VSLDKYARPEIERRFLLHVVPSGLDDPVELTDRYMDGGHLRLRKAEAAGTPTVYKLGHKRRPEEADHGLVMHTTIYLTAEEHAMFEQLPARELRKTRFRCTCDGRPAVVDVFHGAREGLVVLEVGFSPDEDPTTFVPPSWVGPETTLSGGDLAR